MIYYTKKQEPTHFQIINILYKIKSKFYIIDLRKCYILIFYIHLNFFKFF